MKIRWTVAVLLAALCGCGESAEAKYARALAVWNQEVEVRDKAQKYLTLLESNKQADHTARIQGDDLETLTADLEAIDKEYAPKLAKAKEEVERQDERVERAKKLLSEAEAVR